MKDEISSLNYGAKYSGRDIVTALDHLNVLDQQMEDLSYRVEHLSSSSSAVMRGLPLILLTIMSFLLQLLVRDGLVIAMLALLTILITFGVHLNLLLNLVFPSPFVGVSVGS